jgi:hypothetical protein
MISNSKTLIEPDSDEEWKTSLDKIKYLEGIETYEREYSKDEIAKMLAMSISKNHDFLFVNVGSWLRSVWVDKIVDILENAFSSAGKDNHAFFIATSGPKIDKDSDFHPILQKLFELQKKGKGLVFKMQKRIPLHFKCQTYFNTGHFGLIGNFESKHSEIDYLRKHHVFGSTATYLTLSRLFLREIILKGEQTTKISSYGSLGPKSR